MDNEWDSVEVDTELASVQVIDDRNLVVAEVLDYGDTLLTWPWRIKLDQSEARLRASACQALSSLPGRASPPLLRPRSMWQ